VEAIRRRTRELSYEILVVDNHSGLELSCMSSGEADMRVIASERNLGYGAACHRAAQEARGKYLFFINNDTELLNDAAAILCRYLESHPEVALAGPQLLDAQGRSVCSFDYFPSFASKMFGIQFIKFFKPRDFPLKDGSVKIPTVVDLVSGACLFIRAAVYRAMGGFDPQFFLYCEEEDLALRLRQRNLKVCFLPEAKVMHVGGGSSKDKAALKKEFYISFFKFYRKHYGALRTKIIALVCLNQFIWRYFFGKEKELWGPLIRWSLRGAPESESLRYAPGNIDGYPGCNVNG